MTIWRCGAGSILPVGNYVLHEDAIAAVAAERERCAQIAQRVSDKYVQQINDHYARRTIATRDMLQYADGASDAAEEILDEIEGKDDDTHR